MFIKIFLALTIISYLSCQKSDTKDISGKRVNTGQDTCDNPDADINCSFLGMPENLTNIMTIADKDEVGRRMILKGQLLKGTNPLSDVIIYAYHTDNSGRYSKKGNETGVQKWHGYLHGWCKTGKDGRYEIHSIKPVMYPSNNAPAHVHWTIKLPDGSMMYLNDFVFSGDKHVNDEYLSHLRSPGDNGVITLNENSEGVLVGERITVLD